MTHGAPTHRHSHHDIGWTREEALTALEGDERRRMLNPDAFWDHIRLPTGAAVLDVGAGSGFFSVPAAHGVGSSGIVYAVDIAPELVTLLQERRTTEGLPQLRPILSTVDRIPLPTGIADVVLLANVLHDISPSTVREAVRILKPQGRLANLDWKKADSPGGPPLEIRLNEAEATRILGDHDLSLVDQWEPGPYHYALLFRRSGR
jgi:ubiquinone/menaquinone biosynthesis C-methylase UbiE